MNEQEVPQAVVSADASTHVLIALGLPLLLLLPPPVTVTVTVTITATMWTETKKGEKPVLRAGASFEVLPQDPHPAVARRRGLVLEEGRREAAGRQHVRAAAGEEQASGRGEDKTKYCVPLRLLLLLLMLLLALLLLLPLLLLVFLVPLLLLLLLLLVLVCCCCCCC